jgi:hypothetical protein
MLVCQANLITMQLADALEAKIGMNDGVGAVMDIQLWINAFACVLLSCPRTIDPLIMGLRLDTIGIAGFSHDFGALSDHVSPVLKAFNDMHASEQSIGDAFIMLFWTFFSRACLSTPRQRAMDALSNACSTLARELCDRVNADGPEEISVLGLLGELVCQPGSVVILTTRVQSRLSRESRTVFSRKSSLLRSGRRS